jgi:D-sedoheptulose 7-phosphate isomerase
MELREIISKEFIEAQTVLERFINDKKNFELIANAAKLMAESLKLGSKIISCGNGGSHCDAMHFAEELSGRYRGDRKSLAAIAISDVSHISCVGNDYGFDYVFSRFIEGLGNQGDVLVAISTSGNSKNIINAVNAAKEKGMKVILLLGKDGGQLKNIGNIDIIVPHFGFADRIQEIHIKIIHCFILLIEKELGL